jgi:hypothetical protein
MATMKVDMSDRWETLNGDVGSYLDTTIHFIEAVFKAAIRIMVETGMEYKLPHALKDMN